MASRADKAAAYALSSAPLALVLAFLYVLPSAFASPPPPGFLSALATTAAASSIASLLGALSGFVVAFEARRNAVLSALSPLMLSIAVVPPTALGVLLLASLGALRALGAGAAADALINTFAGVVLAMYFVAASTSYSVVEGALRSGELEAFLRSLGLSELQQMALTLASLKRTLLVAYATSWLRGFGELGALLIIAQTPVTAALYIYNAWQIYGVGPAASASLALMAFGSASAYLLLRRWR